jgi:predicted extracellular nuclease
MTQTQKRRLLTLFVIATIGLLIFVSPAAVYANGVEPNSVIRIYEIQGDGFYTPYSYETVTTTGIVTADYQAENRGGFFLQDPTGDPLPEGLSTSDGIFVYEPSNYDTWPYLGIFDVNLGDEITITGRVRDRYGMTQMDNVEEVIVLPNGKSLPDPVELDPPKDDYESDVYYERLEGMLVSVECMRAVAGTDGYGELAGVVADSGIRRVFEDDPLGTGELIFTDDEGGYVVTARSGSMIKNLVGPLDYTYDEYKIQVDPLSPPDVVPNWWAESDWVWPRGLSRGFTVASYNMYNLFDEFDDPDKEDTVNDPEVVELQLTKHALAIKYLLRMPDLIAVQEVENIEILERLTKTKPIQGKYGAVLIEGPYGRAVDVGLLYRKNRVTIISAEARQTCTDLDDDYGPGTDPNFPCPEGHNPLFSRPPLVVHLKTHGKWCRGRHGGGTELWLVINHFKSKSQYGTWPYPETEPRRIEQAAWVGNLVDEIQEANCKAKVMVIGDLNSYENEAPITTLIDGGLTNLVFEVNKRSRYTYIYRGRSGVLDHILVTDSLLRYFRRARIVHFNTDFPKFLWDDDSSTGVRASDHDVLMASFWIR